MLLADAFWCCAVDDMSGRVRLSSGIAGIGLAGALLGELSMTRMLVVDGGRVRVQGDGPHPDPVAEQTRALIVSAPDVVAVQDWLRFLARDSETKVGERLVRRGIAQRANRRKLLRTVVEYRPVSMNEVVAVPARLAALMTHRGTMTIEEVVLAGLLEAAGLGPHVFADLPDPSVPRRLAARLPPPLRALVDETRAAVGAAVLAHRA